MYATGMGEGPDRTTDERAAAELEGELGLTLNHPTAARSGEMVRRFRVTVVEGPGAGTSKESTGDRLTIGSHQLNDLVIDDGTVSRFHCELRIDEGAAVISDLRSKNGTLVDGVEVREAVLRSGSLLRMGRAVARFEDAGEHNVAALSPLTRFGPLVGASRAMRRTIAQLERAAASDVTVLLEGETGTGKGKAAEALHQASARRDRPFVVVDCGALTANLLESELFGHEKGAFTGAEGRRVGAFEEASGGTVFLDEIGEMPADLQPKLLRALENREIRRVGSNRFLPVDLRVIAATNRDLRAEVNAGRFRSDLYYRIAVLKILMPSLRQRPEDIAAIAGELLAELGLGGDTAERLLTPSFVAELGRTSWPGNARELRNHLARAVVLADDGRDGPDTPDARVAQTDDELAAPGRPLTEARRAAVDAWERAYLTSLMRLFPGKVAEAARSVGVDRVYLYRLLRKHGLKPG